MCSIFVFYWMFLAPAASARWLCFSGLFLLLSFRNGDIRGGMQSAEVRTVWKHSCGRNFSLLVFILVILLTEPLGSDPLAKRLELVCASWFLLFKKKKVRCGMVPQTFPIFLICKEKATGTKWQAPGNKLINMGGQWCGSNRYMSHKLLSHACNWRAKHWIAKKLLMADELCLYDRFVSEDYPHDTIHYRKRYFRKWKEDGMSTVIRLLFFCLFF